MQDATEFGKVIRELMAKNNLRQEQLAKELKISPAIFSNYITGKNIPDMDFLIRCINRFKLDKGTLANLFYTVFLSSAEKNHKMIIDTRFIQSTQIELAKALTVLMLYPPQGSYPRTNRKELEDYIKSCFSELERMAVFKPPAD